MTGCSSAAHVGERRRGRVRKWMMVLALLVGALSIATPTAARRTPTPTATPRPTRTPTPTATPRATRTPTPLPSTTFTPTATPTASTTPPSQHLAIPSYFYPGSSWTQMTQGSPAVGVTVINPASGPGSSSNADYVRQVQQSQAAGLIVLGYVPTGYGGRAVADVEAEIDDYNAWYHVDGIFFDEANTVCGFQAYYSTLTAYAKQSASARPGPHTVLNPGVQTSECYMSVVDVVITFEGSNSTYTNSYSAPSWVAQYPANRFWHLIYSAPTTQEMQASLARSKQRRAGWVYITPDTLPNPWDTLPPAAYWQAELAGG